jgi:hypothetical protein
MARRPNWRSKKSATALRGRRCRSRSAGPIGGVERRAPVQGVEVPEDARDHRAEQAGRDRAHAPRAGPHQREEETERAQGDELRMQPAQRARDHGRAQRAAPARPPPPRPQEVGGCGDGRRLRVESHGVDRQRRRQREEGPGQEGGALAEGIPHRVIHEHARQRGQGREEELRPAMAEGAVGGQDQEGEARRMDRVEPAGRAVLGDVPGERARVEAGVLAVRELVGEIEITVAPEALCHREVVRFVALRARRTRDPRRERGIESEGHEEEEQVRRVSGLALLDTSRERQKGGGAGDEGQHGPLQGQEWEPMSGVDGHEGGTGKGEPEKRRPPSSRRPPRREGGQGPGGHRRDGAQDAGSTGDSPPGTAASGHDVEARVPEGEGDGDRQRHSYGDGAVTEDLASSGHRRGSVAVRAGLGIGHRGVSSASIAKAVPRAAMIEMGE